MLREGQMARAQKTKREQEMLRVEKNQPLIAVPQEDSSEIYYASEEAADAARTDETLRQALETAGAFSDLSWEDAEADFERIRHEGRSSPPSK
jgi:hypothetical protein